MKVSIFTLLHAVLRSPSPNDGTAMKASILTLFHAVLRKLSSNNLWGFFFFKG